MFIIDQTIKDFKIRERNIIKVFFSMNKHQVATPEMMLEEARTYIMFFREAKHKISAYIGLHLLITDRKLYYAHPSNPFPEEELDAVQEEALSFAEGLGAMLDEIDFSRLSSEEAVNWMDNQDIFKSLPETKSTPETRTAIAVQSELPAGQQVPSGPSPVSEHAILSHAPLPSIDQSASVTPYVQSPQQQEVQPPPIVPHTATIPQSSHPQQVTTVEPAPQQASPVTPEVQQPRHAQTAPAISQGQGLSKEELGEMQPYEQAPVDPKSEGKRPPQRKPGAGIQGIQAKLPPRATAAKTPSSAAHKSRQEIFEQAIKSGFVKVPKPSGRKASPSAAGFVSRDREALARLLTSF
jgi:hypothetical protein